MAESKDTKEFRALLPELNEPTRIEAEALLQQRADCVRRIETLQARMRRLRNLGSITQDEAVLVWQQHNEDQPVVTKFTAGPEENYVVSLRDFQNYLEDVGEGFMALPFQDGVTYNYDALEPPAGHFKVLGASYRDGETLVRGTVDGNAMLARASDSGLHVVLVEKKLETTKDVRREIAAFVELVQKLPAYVAATVFELVERRPKISVLAQAKAKFRRLVPVGPVVYKVIRAVRKIYVGERLAQFLARAEPAHKVPVRGFWRQVKGVGRDADGNPCFGKTWVRGHTRWNDKPDPEFKVVWIKEKLEGLGAALRDAESQHSE